MSEEQNNKAADEFAREADAKDPGLVAEVVDFLRHTKKWWLTPIIVFLLLISGLVVLLGTGAGAALYTIF